MSTPVTGPDAHSANTPSAKTLGTPALRQLELVIQHSPDFIASQELTRRILASMTDCVKILDLDGNLLQMNELGQKLLGINDLQPFLGTCWIDFWKGSDNDAAKTAVEKAKAGEVGHFEGFFATLTGVSKWWDVVVTPIFGPDGKPEKLLSISRDITERRLAEIELQDARQRIEAVLSAGEVGTWTYEIPLNRVTVDKNLAKLLGVSAEEAANGHIEAYMHAIHPDDTLTVLAAIDAALHDGNSYHAEHRIIRPDGSTRFIIARGKVERDENGVPVRLPGVVLDVTDQHELQTRLEQSEAQFRQLADAMPQIVWAAQPDGSLDYYNHRWFEYIDVRPDQIEQARWDRFIHTDDLPCVYDAWTHSVRTGEPYSTEFRIKRADGQYRWFLVRALSIRNSDGAITRWFGTCTDVHEQRELQARLERSEALFRQLADTITQLAWMAKPDGWVFWYNQRWYEYTGTTPAQMEGWGWQRVHDPAELQTVLTRWRSSIDTGEPFDMTFPIKGADGKFRPFLTRCMPLRDETGQIVLWFGTNTDVSEQRRMVEERDELLASERAARSTAEHASRMKDDFLATLSHELRTPLNAILGWSQLIRRGGLSGPDLQQGLETIERNARVQTQLIEDLLDMSRIISGKLRLDVQPIEPASFIEAAIETVMPAATSKGIRIEKALDPCCGPVSGDSNRLQQVVWNLLSNAIKFTPRGGTVHVRLERVNSHLQISVADDGQGIAADFLPHVFDRFRQEDSSTSRKHSGLGLGLAIVKQLVELHGGTVRVKSDGENQGATFFVDLPVTATRTYPDDSHSLYPKTPRLAPADCENTRLAGLKILVVDDEPDARQLMKRILEECKTEVFIASNATEAFEMIKANRPDVLISDIGMAEVDGYEFLRRVRTLAPKDGPHIPAIALTAFARTEDRTRALLTGFLAHVSKPVEPSELIATIAAVAGRIGNSQG